MSNDVRLRTIIGCAKRDNSVNRHSPILTEPQIHGSYFDRTTNSRGAVMKIYGQSTFIFAWGALFGPKNGILLRFGIDLGGPKIE